MSKTPRNLFVCQLTKTQSQVEDTFELPDSNSWYVKYISTAPDSYFSRTSEKVKFETYRSVDDIILVGNDNNSFALISYDGFTTVVDSDRLVSGNKNFVNTIIWHDKNEEFYIYHKDTNVFKRIPNKDHTFAQFKIVSKDVIPHYNIKPVIILD